MPGKSSVPSRNRATATSSAAISAAEARLPMRPASRAIRSAGKRASSGARKSSCAAATRSGGAAGDGRRSGCVRAYWMGSRISGVPSWALSEPSTNRTAEWTTLCGMHDDVDGVVADIVQPVCLDHFQALVREGGGVDRDLRAHRPRRVAQRLRRRHRGERLGGASRNGPPDAVSTSRAIAARGSPTRHCQIAECSESIGRSHASGVGQRVGGAGGGGALGGPRAGLGHHEVAAGDERLLVGGRDHLAGPQRGEHRAAATRRPPVPTTTRSTSSRVASASSASAPPIRAVPAAGRAAPPSPARLTTAGPEPRRLRAQLGGVAPARERHDVGSGRRAARARRPPGARCCRSSRAGRRGSRGRSPGGRRVSGRTRGHTARRRGAANRNESIRSRMPPWPGIRVPESFAPAARLSIDSARSPAWATRPSSGPSTIAPSGGWPRPASISATTIVHAISPPTRPFDRLRGRDVGQELVPADLAARRGRRRCRSSTRRARSSRIQPRSAPRAASGADGVHRRRHRRDVEDEREHADVDRPEHRRDPGHEPVARIRPHQAADARRGPRRWRPARGPSRASGTKPAWRTSAMAIAVPNSASDG